MLEPESVIVEHPACAELSRHSCLVVGCCAALTFLVTFEKDGMYCAVVGCVTYTVRSVLRHSARAELGGRLCSVIGLHAALTFLVFFEEDGMYCAVVGRAT